jgi:hypothetical protein
LILSSLLFTDKFFFYPGLNDVLHEVIALGERLHQIHEIAQAIRGDFTRAASRLGDTLRAMEENYGGLAGVAVAMEVAEADRAPLAIFLENLQLALPSFPFGLEDDAAELWDRDPDAAFARAESPFVAGGDTGQGSSIGRRGSRRATTREATPVGDDGDLELEGPEAMANAAANDPALLFASDDDDDAPRRSATPPGMSAKAAGKRKAR